MASDLKELQASIIARLGAKSLALNPYIYPELPISRSDYTALAEQHNTSVRLFYLSRYLGPSHIQALITQVPAVSVDGDRYVSVQSGQVYGSLAECSAEHPNLISNEQRRLARNKCLASFVTVLAVGGYGSPAVPLAKSSYFECVVVSGAGPQFEAAYLDFADLFVIKDSENSGAARCDRLPAYSHLSSTPPREWDAVKSAARPAMEAVTVTQDLNSPLSAVPALVRFAAAADVVFDAKAFVTTMQETLHLYLSAFDSLVASRGPNAKGYFKLVSIGTGFFATLPRKYGGINLGRILMPFLLRCALDLLLRVGEKAYTHIHAIEFPDFSGEEIYTPSIDKIGHVRLVKAPMKDVLDFPEDVRKGENGWVPGVLNPGDCFALVGNERGHGSVEAMIGCNSTLRFNQNYLWNEHVLDQTRWKGVQLEE